MKIINKLLQNPKIKSIILVPPATIWVVMMLYVYFSFLIPFQISNLAFPIYLGILGWLAIGLCLILFVDYKRNKKFWNERYNKINNY